MKKFLIFILTISCGFFQAQDYSPFKAEQYKRFQSVTDSEDNDFYFYPYQHFVNGDTITFYQYLKFGDTTVDLSNTNCASYGGYDGIAEDTTWLGKKITYLKNSKKLLFMNKQLQQISFDFSLSLNDSSLFYSNNNENYYIKFKNVEFKNFLNYNDSIKIFKISKYDNVGNLLADELNNFEIKLGKTLGLLSFFDCFSFPTEKRKLVLMGQANPDVGYYQITYDELFPFQPGDKMQFHGRSALNNCYVITTSYNMVNVLDRIETSDSVWLYFQNNITNDYPQEAPCPETYYVISYPNILKFKKNTCFTYFPYGTFNTINHSSGDWYCGNREYLSIEDESMYHYCEGCGCFVDWSNGYGYPYGGKSYMTGLGYYSSSFLDGTTIEYEDLNTSELIYSKINGVECGQALFTGLDQLDLDNKSGILKTTDILGREINGNLRGLQLQIFKSGKVKKLFEVED